MTSTTVASPQELSPSDAAAGESTFTYSRRRPTTGDAQAKRKAWGATWGPIIRDLASASKERRR